MPLRTNLLETDIDAVLWPWGLPSGPILPELPPGISDLTAVFGALAVGDDLRLPLPGGGRTWDRYVALAEVVRGRSVVGPTRRRPRRCPGNPGRSRPNGARRRRHGRVGGPGAGCESRGARRAGRRFPAAGSQTLGLWRPCPHPRPGDRGDARRRLPVRGPRRAGRRRRSSRDLARGRNGDVGQRRCDLRHRDRR